jgi:hypothetical protein
MKRSLIASLLGITVSVAMVASSHGEGVILFNNYDIGNPLDQVRDSGGNPVTDTSVIIGLWAGQGVLTDSSALQLIATTPIFSVPYYGGGWYSMGVSGIGYGFAVIPSSIFTGTETVTFQIRGSGGAGPGLTGQSALWQETPINFGGSLLLFPNPPNEMENGPLPLTLYPVPEPSTIALASLGVAGLLFSHRRK